MTFGGLHLDHLKLWSVFSDRLMSDFSSNEGMKHCAPSREKGIKYQLKESLKVIGSQVLINVQKPLGV